MAVVGKKFSVDFEQATEVNGNTQILVQSEDQPVEKASVEQLGVALMDEDIIPNPAGIYPKMSVGFAENVVGDGSTTEEEFSLRPTAGINRNTLNDGAARIHTLKGNSIVANQLFNITKDGELKNGLSYTRVGDNTIILNGTATTFTVFFFGTGADIIANHSYFLGAIDGAENTQDWYFTNQMTMNSYGGMAVINTHVSSVYTSILLRVNEGVTFDNKRITINFIDLTLMFGEGNEPTTVAEFYQRRPVGLDLAAYNESEIVDGNYGAIKAIGFNAFNGTYAKVLGGVQYYLGGNYTSVGFATETGGVIEAITTPTSSEVAGGSAPADRLYTPSQNGYIYANGDSICISLYWPTEYSNLYGTYKPYKPFERDLSWVNKYFPNGMRSAGSAHDEIRFNSTTQQWEAVQRVDVRPYAAGDESDTAVTTDGTNTNYALVTPDVKEMDEIPNFDFDVSDYGTEELIVAEGVESAPLSASIEYSPNVLAVLKNAPNIANDVNMLKSQLAALTAQFAALTATNNE